MKKVLISFLLIFFACPIFVSANQIDINSATLSQLDEIVHVGTKTAQKIIDARPYSSVQDLNRVKGIGNGKYLQDIINQGWACVNCQTTINTSLPEITATAPITATTSPSNTEPLPTPAITYPSGVLINEIFPNPEGPDETNEWIELYNSNNFDVDLSGWQLQDIAGTTTTYTIPAGTKILTDGFLVFKRPDTKIMLNNDEDGLNLLAPDGKIVDSVGFTSAPLGQSYNKTSGAWQWSKTSTPGAKNIIASAKTLSNTKNSVKNTNINSAEAAAADISQSINTNQDNKTTNPWFLFFTVLATTIILAVIVLLIKLKISKKII